MSGQKATPETVLVVEDEVLIRMEIAAYLRECGYKVIEVSNGDEALSLLEKHALRVDVVFSNVQMPGNTDGFKLSQWLRKNRPDVQIVLTGTINRAATEAADLCDESPLPKPYDHQTVVDRIKRLLGAAATSNLK
jgi:CheY-like chemotaxis protein